MRGEVWCGRPEWFGELKGAGEKIGDEKCECLSWACN
jgi:hypothetical protein